MTNAEKMEHLGKDIFRAFTQHPHETGETYLQHLRFTLGMALRFALVSMIITIHGFFPFLMPTTASRYIEKLYWVMKGRIPKARRDVIDAAYLDYSV
jgi:hypothetical protein